METSSLPDTAASAETVRFDTRIAVVVRDDLPVWQKLNVTAFLMSGIAAQHPDVLGEPYVDADGRVYNPLCRQPIICMVAGADVLRKIHGRAIEKGATTSAYIEEMFSTGHDAANRAVFAKFGKDDARIVGVALRDTRKRVDKITDGARMHP
jgi:hypothetical protein